MRLVMELAGVVGGRGVVHLEMNAQPVFYMSYRQPQQQIVLLVCAKSWYISHGLCIADSRSCTDMHIMQLSDTRFVKIPVLMEIDKSVTPSPPPYP